MSKNPVDHDHSVGQGRAVQYPRVARVTAEEGRHRNVRLLEQQRRRKGATDASRVKQFLRIERGYLA